MGPHKRLEKPLSHCDRSCCHAVGHTRRPEGKLKICVTGAGGFIASHLARRLKNEGHYVIACDWKRNEHMTEDMFCHEFMLVDLRVYDNCMKVTKDCEHVFNLAADMGGMGFIQSNHSVIM